MIDVEKRLAAMTAALRARFGGRLAYVGLQGSYLRGEADEQSDFDLMVVLDEAMPDDLAAYRDLLRAGGWADTACGFVCGREELARWNAPEVCHLVHTTRDYVGTLTALIPPYTPEDVCTYVLTGLDNLWHLLCHSYVHASGEGRATALREGYRSAFFLMQNLLFQKHKEKNHRRQCAGGGGFL